jgi:hypothetical protein
MQHTKDDKGKEKDDDFEAEHKEDRIYDDGERTREHVRCSHRKQKKTSKRVEASLKDKGKTKVLVNKDDEYINNALYVVAY